MAQASIPRLIALSQELTNLINTGSILSYDQETVMPPKGARDRAEQLSYIQGMIHAKLTAPELGGLVEELWADREKLSADDRANVRETRRAHLRAKKVPADLVVEMARTHSLAHHAWAHARKKSDFPAFAPWLETIFSLKRREAEAIGYEKDPYDALLDGYETGMTVAQLDPLFAKLRQELVPIVAAIASAPRKPKLEILSRKVPLDKQRDFTFFLAKEMGFDEDAGRMDLSTHPFCSTLGAGDVRITNRYREDEPLSGISGVMHETGHALYEQGLDPAQSAVPMGKSVSLGIHESQSRSWENIIGRGLPFWKHYYPKLQKAWAPVFDDVSLEDFYFAVNAVRPSFIRVEADEVTYNLHVLLRYEIERDIFAGKLAIEELPKVWNAKMQEYLGVTPPDDAQGVLQDTHWSSGLIGYFPTYTLGTLCGSQFHEAAVRAIPDLDARLERGDLKTLREWQRENIHRQGSRHEPAELVKQVTGKAPDSSFFVRYLNEKFGPLYGIHGDVGAK